MATETSGVEVQSNNDNDADSTQAKVEQLSEETKVSDEAMNDDETGGDNDDMKFETKVELKDDHEDESEQEDGEEYQDDSNQDMVCQNDESMDDKDKTNLIVNYLPQNMTDEEFKKIFEKFGEMKSCKIVRNRMTGYSYGFGFVDFQTHEQAIKAIEELNGHELDTKKIKVAFARPAGQDIKQANLYVKNIPFTWTQDDVRRAFESFGNIIQVRVLGNDRGVAFVLYDLRKQAEMALEAMQGKKLDGAEEALEIKFAADRKSDKKRSRRGRGGGGGGGGTNDGSGGGGGGGRARERGSRGGVNRKRTDPRRGGMNRGMRGNSNQRGNINNNNNNNNINNRPNNNNHNNSDNNNGFGPIRNQPAGRMNRFAPFAPVHQQAQIQQPTQISNYAYPQQQIWPYMQQGMMPMRPDPMLQYNTAAAAAATQPLSATAAMGPMGAYPMGAASAATPQMTPYGTSAVAVGSQAMTNMYSMASNTMQNAAQMQPQLGQPMNNQLQGAAQARAYGGHHTGGGGGGGQSNDSSKDGVTLFVYNIGPQSDESELRSMFEQFGSVIRCNVVRKTPGGETKGYGFVTLPTRAEAQAAINKYDGKEKNGKTLQVSFKK